LFRHRFLTLLSEGTFANDAGGITVVPEKFLQRLRIIRWIVQDQNRFHDPAPDSFLEVFPNAAAAGLSAIGIPVQNDRQRPVV
jgi:hypothetical protein